jgi:hypothetical protein
MRRWGSRVQDVRLESLTYKRVRKGQKKETNKKPKTVAQSALNFCGL